MHREGFEPSRVATSHLECDSLDRSDICARYLSYLYPYFTKYSFPNFLLDSNSPLLRELIINIKLETVSVFS
jgi:hypothetical protein